MTAELFYVSLAAIIAGAYLSVRLCDLPFILRRLTGVDVVAPPTAATISIMFGLFVAFGTSEITQRTRELNLAVQKEVSVIRSIVQFADGVGTSASPLRQALVEYLQSVTTLEQTWLERNSPDEDSPAQDTADTMVQVVTLFVAQSPASPSVKSLIVNKVDDLRQARTERISALHRSSTVMQWVAHTTIALITQFTIALGYVGKLHARRFAVGAFTAAAALSISFMGWSDGLIGPSKVAAAMLPLRNVLAAMTN